MVNVLAIDPGRHCGWALGSSQLNLTHGVLLFEDRKKDPPGTRYLRFALWVRSMLSAVDGVVVEDVKRHEGVAAAHVYGGMRAVLASECCAVGIPIEAVGVGVWKKKAIGNGASTKTEVRERVNTILGVAITDDNEADACGIWLGGAKAFPVRNKGGWE